MDMASRRVGGHAEMISNLAEPIRGGLALSPSARNDLRTELPIDIAKQSVLRRRFILDGCKWDPQVGDINTLAPFPIVMPRRVWNQLARQAEQLASEAVAAEAEIVRRPHLLAALGLPVALQSVLRDAAPLTPAPGRVIRFDFHPTTQGWRITEANSDVPGGFGEASYFTRLMSNHFPGLQPAGDPAAVWCQLLASATGPAGMIALLSATGYMEDHQVNAFLAARLREFGCRAQLVTPEQIRWRDGIASLDTPWYRGPVAAILRFYQAEWLSRLPASLGWKFYFRGGKTPVANPALAIISESKRVPLVWSQLATQLPTWQALLPETRDPRDVGLNTDESWLLKTAICNTGDAVSARDWLQPHQWRAARWRARLFPWNWIAQKRFESLPVATPEGPRHACVGIYTVNGKAAGAYVRLSEKPWVDYLAVDAALLLTENE